MANEQNLVPFDERTESEARELGKKGGIASGAARRRKRALKEAADYFLSLPVSDTKVRSRLSKAGIDPSDIDNQMAMICGLHAQAAKGDAKAAKVLIDLLGEDSGADSEGVQIIDDL